MRPKFAISGERAFRMGPTWQKAGINTELSVVEAIFSLYGVTSVRSGYSGRSSCDEPRSR